LKPRVHKRDNTIASLTTRTNIEFRDISCMLAPSTSLQEFGQLVGLEHPKTHFPFAFLDSAARLTEPSLPWDDSFWRSEVPNGQQAPDEVASIKAGAWSMWNDLACQTVGEYLARCIHLNIEFLLGGTCKWNRILKEAIGLSFIELGCFDISTLCHLAGLKSQERSRSIGTFFPNNSQVYSVLQSGVGR